MNKKDFSKNEKMFYNLGYRADKNGYVYDQNGKECNMVLNSDFKFYITRRINKKEIFLYVSRFIAYLKFGEKIYDKGIVVRHLNDKSTDNSWDNIAIGTQSDNLKDYYNNKKNNGERTPTKFSHETNYVSFNEYAKMCGVSRQAISNRIKRGSIIPYIHYGLMDEIYQYIDILKYPPEKFYPGRKKIKKILA